MEQHEQDVAVKFSEELTARETKIAELRKTLKENLDSRKQSDEHFQKCVKEELVELRSRRRVPGARKRGRRGRPGPRRHPTQDGLQIINAQTRDTNVPRAASVRGFEPSPRTRTTRATGSALFLLSW